MIAHGVQPKPAREIARFWYHPEKDMVIVVKRQATGPYWFVLFVADNGELYIAETTTRILRNAGCVYIGRI